MVGKVLFSLLVFAACQASASSLIARSRLEFLATRQTPGSCQSDCAAFDDVLNSCSSASCLCTPAVAASLQVCINCGVAADPSTAMIQAAEALIDAYEDTCAGVILPTLTIPAGSVVTSTSATSSRVARTTASRTASTVTAVNTLPPPSTSRAVLPTSTSTDTSAGGLPAGLNRSASLRTVATNTIIVTISAMLGAALLFR